MQQIPVTRLDYLRYLEMMNRVDALRGKESNHRILDELDNSNPLIVACSVFYSWKAMTEWLPRSLRNLERFTNTPMNELYKGLESAQNYGEALDAFNAEAIVKPLDKNDLDMSSRQRMWHSIGQMLADIKALVQANVEGNVKNSLRASIRIGAQTQSESVLWDELWGTLSTAEKVLAELFVSEDKEMN